MKRFLIGLLALTFVAGTTFAQTQPQADKKAAPNSTQMKVERKEAVKAVENKEAAVKQTTRHEVKVAKEEVKAAKKEAKAAKKEVKAAKKEVKAEKKEVKEAVKTPSPALKK